MTRKALALAVALGVAGPAAAQYYVPPPPPGPPPGYYPAPPPPRAPPPPYYPAQPPPPPPPALQNTLRLSGGMALTSTGYYCGYVYGPGYAYPACGAAYSAVLGNINLDLDLGLSRASAITIGANVMLGSYSGVSSTIWEPHLDYLLRGSPSSVAQGRFRMGAGIYIASASANGMNVATGSVTGGTFRIGGGLSFLPESQVGIGLDAIFEAGGLNGYYMSTLQLLVGPEFHF